MKIEQREKRRRRRKEAPATLTHTLSLSLSLCFPDKQSKNTRDSTFLFVHPTGTVIGCLMLGQIFKVTKQTYPPLFFNLPQLVYCICIVVKVVAVFKFDALIFIAALDVPMNAAFAT